MVIAPNPWAVMAATTIIVLPLGATAEDMCAQEKRSSCQSLLGVSRVTF